MYAQPTKPKRPPLASTLVLALLCALGAAAFLYPFFLSAPALSEQAAHAADAPLIFALLGPALLALLVADLGAGQLTPRRCRSSARPPRPTRCCTRPTPHPHRQPFLPPPS